MDPNENIAISTDVLNRLRDETGDEDGSLIRELVEVFCVDAEESSVRLTQLLEAKDGNALSREAHRVKSGAANMGALRISALCKEVEQTAGDGDLQTAGQSVSQLLEEVPRAIAGLRAYLETL